MEQFSRFVVLVGRILFASVFVWASASHFSQHTIAYAGQRGMPAPHIFIPLTGLIVLLGGLSILFGYRARWGAWMLVVVLLPFTFMMHNFWTVCDPKAAMIEHVMFMKNLALLGAALMITYFGSGPFSLRR